MGHDREDTRTLKVDYEETWKTSFDIDVPASLADEDVDQYLHDHYEDWSHYIEQDYLTETSLDWSFEPHAGQVRPIA